MRRSGSGLRPEKTRETGKNGHFCRVSQAPKMGSEIVIFGVPAPPQGPGRAFFQGFWMGKKLRSE